MSVVSKQASAGDDAFFERLFSKLPSDVATSFNDDQLKVISYAFGTRRWREHAVDLRRIFSLFGRSYYFVLLAGAERRSRRRRLRDRLLHPLMSIGNGIVAVVFLRRSCGRSWRRFMFSSHCWGSACLKTFRSASCRCSSRN